MSEALKFRIYYNAYDDTQILFFKGGEIMRTEDKLNNFQEAARDHIKSYDDDSTIHFGRAILWGGVALVSVFKALCHYGYCAYLSGAQKELERIDRGLDTLKE